MARGAYALQATACVRTSKVVLYCDNAIMKRQDPTEQGSARLLLQLGH